MFLFDNKDRLEKRNRRNSFQTFPDSVCVSTFLSQKTQNIDLTCTSENQMCMSTCLGGYIQDDGGLSTVYNCSGEGWFPPLKSCISKSLVD